MKRLNLPLVSENQPLFSSLAHDLPSTVSLPAPTSFDFSRNGQETFYGSIDTTFDALLIFQAIANRQLTCIEDRLECPEENIRSGSIYVYESSGNGIKRWTDKMMWSPSRIVGNFLIYKQLDAKMDRPGSSRRNIERGIIKTEEGNLGVNSSKGIYVFKGNGLEKKTITMKIGSRRCQLIAYYRKEDDIPSVSLSSMFSTVSEINESILRQAKRDFRNIDNLNLKSESTRNTFGLRNQLSVNEESIPVIKYKATNRKSPQRNSTKKKLLVEVTLSDFEELNAVRRLKRRVTNSEKRKKKPRYTEKSSSSSSDADIMSLDSSSSSGFLSSDDETHRPKPILINHGVDHHHSEDEDDEDEDSHIGNHIPPPIPTHCTDTLRKLYQSQDTEKDQPPSSKLNNTLAPLLIDANHFISAPSIENSAASALSPIDNLNILNLDFEPPPLFAANLQPPITNLVYNLTPFNVDQCQIQNGIDKKQPNSSKILLFNQTPSPTQDQKGFQDVLEYWSSLTFSPLNSDLENVPGTGGRFEGLFLGDGETIMSIDSSSSSYFSGVSGGGGGYFDDMRLMSVDGSVGSFGSMLMSVDQSLDSFGSNVSCLSGSELGGQAWEELCDVGDGVVGLGIVEGGKIPVVEERADSGCLF